MPAGGAETADVPSLASRVARADVRGKLTFRPLAAGPHLNRLLTVAALAAAMSASSVAGATPPELASSSESDAERSLQTHRYTTAFDIDYLRAVLEGVGVIGIGFTEYLVSTKRGRGGEIPPAYDWSIFRDKLGGNAQSFDVNHLNTNFIGHPLGGTLYYLSARANRMGFLASFAWAFTGSLIWEYLGEINEKPSLNDMLVTPWAGVANGETLTQLGAFFARGKRNAANAILGAVFDGPKSAHDAIDRLEPERSETFDGLGFPSDIWHRFEVSLGASVTSQAARIAPRTEYVDQRLRLDAEVVNLPDYGRAGKHSLGFSDGNLANLRFDMALSNGKVVDALFATRATLFGHYERNARVGPDGKLHGDGSVIGYYVGFEYGVHDYDRDRAGPVDYAALVTLGGLGTEYVRDSGPVRLRAQLRAGVDFGGVFAYAVSNYAKAQDPARLPSVLRNEGYYFAAGPSVVSRVDLSVGPLELGGALRLDDWHAVLGLDDDAQKLTNEISRSDRRLRASSWLGFRFASDHLRLGAEVTGLVRSGTVGNIHDRRTEGTATASLGALF